MGADSPDDSLLFAGGLPGARPSCASGPRPTRFPCWCSASRMRWRRSSCAGIPACSSSTGTSARRRGRRPGAPAQAAMRSRPSCRSRCSRPTTTRSRCRPGSRPGRTRSSPGSSLRPNSARGSTPCWCGPSGTSRCIPPPGSRAPPRSSARSGAGSSRSRSSRSATPTSTTSRNSTTATATTTATGSSTCCPGSCTTS